MVKAIEKKVELKKLGIKCYYSSCVALLRACSSEEERREGLKVVRDFWSPLAWEDRYELAELQRKYCHR